MKNYYDAKTLKEKIAVINEVLNDPTIMYWAVVGKESRDTLYLVIGYTEENIDYYKEKILSMYLDSIKDVVVKDAEERISKIKSYLERK